MHLELLICTIASTMGGRHSGNNQTPHNSSTYDISLNCDMMRFVGREKQRCTGDSKLSSRYFHCRAALGHQVLKASPLFCLSRPSC